MKTHNGCSLNKYDRVKLHPKYDNDVEYMVSEPRENGIIGLFPVNGGMLVSACIKNLIKL